MELWLWIPALIRSALSAGMTRRELFNEHS
jgi:hypothetical protein